MTKRSLLTAGLLICFCAGTLMADAPGLMGGVKLQDSGGNIDLTYDTNPCSVDWNNDGRKDLLLGEFTYGHITLYLNMGTDLNPKFGFGTKLESNGTPITVTYG